MFFFKNKGLENAIFCNRTAGKYFATSLVSTVFYFILGQTTFPRYARRTMNAFANFCRALRDLGIFLLGIAALLAVLDYFYFHPDPTREMSKAIYKMYADGFSKSVSEPVTNVPPVVSLPGLSESK
jgi:hypothetical protein